jgi:hypothetical protein
MLGRLFLRERQNVKKTEQSSKKPDPRTYTGAGPGKSIVSLIFYNITKHKNHILYYLRYSLKMDVSS